MRRTRTSLKRNRSRGLELREISWVLTGIIVICILEPVVRTPVSWRLPASLVRSMWARDGRMCTSTPGTMTSGRETRTLSVDRHVEKVQRDTTPLRGLCQGQERVSWTSMRQCRVGQCGSTLKVRRHLERS